MILKTVLDILDNCVCDTFSTKKCRPFNQLLILLLLIYIPLYTVGSSILNGITQKKKKKTLQKMFTLFEFFMFFLIKEVRQVLHDEALCATFISGNLAIFSTIYSKYSMWDTKIYCANYMYTASLELGLGHFFKILFPRFFLQVSR